MQFHVSQLIDLDELQTLMQALYLATGITNALLDPAGEVLVAAGWQESCTDFHRADPKSCARCHVSDQYIAKHLRGGTYIGYECLNGLYDYATPVMIADKHVATIFVGQLLHEPPNLARFRKQAKEFSFNEGRYLAAIQQVPVVPRERLVATMHFLAGFAQSLAKSGLMRLRQLEMNVELEAIVQSRTTELEKAVARLSAEVEARMKTERRLQRSRENLRRLTANLVRVKEKERKRIAREIHDELGQALLAIRIEVSMLQARTGSKYPRLNERCVTTLNTIDSAVGGVKTIINNLRPPALDLNLGAAIEWQVKEFERRSGVPCRLSMSDNDIELNEEQATAVFRILQESLTNIQRHANASRAEIDVRKSNDMFVLQITDDGVGIRTECSQKKNAFGLLGIRERVRDLGGEFRLNVSENVGTMLTISLPQEKTLGT